MRTFCEISYRKKLQVEIRTCLFTVTLTVTLNLLINSSDMLSPRGQAGLEAEIMSSALASASKICPRPRRFVLGLSSNFLFWPRTPGNV